MKCSEQLFVTKTVDENQTKNGGTNPSALIYIVSCIVLFQIACKKFVQVSPPANAITSSTAYTNNISAAAVLTSIYDRMNSGSSLLSSGSLSISFLGGMAADEFKNYSSNAVRAAVYSNSMSASSIYFWNEIYQEIYVTNAAIAGLSASQSISPAIKQQLIGEAKFMRGFFYFYAVNLFGDVPLTTSTDYVINNSISRTAVSKVYEQIVQDLKDAQSNLSDNFLDPAGIITNERVRPNKGAATALLARVYLYLNDWENAKAQSTQVINNTANYNLADSLNAVFLKNSSEAIWQLQCFYPGYNTFDGFYFILTSAPGTGRFYASLGSNLLDSFEAGDNRFTQWVNSITTGGKTYYYPYKYRIGNFKIGNPVTEYVMVFRLAEQYLIRAEAEAQLNDLGGASNDLNKIRERAGLTDTIASNQTDMLGLIYHERKIELFTEWGHRWFDLKRTGNVNQVMSVVTPQKGGTWSPDWALFPIPQSEIKLNKNLVQNPGYGN